MDIIQVFKDAREILRKRGWGKHFHYDRQTDCFCSMGAIREAIACNLIGASPAEGFHWYSVPEHKSAEAYSVEQTAVAFLSALVKQPVASWNDSYERNKNEVLSAFNNAVDKLERMRAERAADDGPAPE